MAFKSKDGNSYGSAYVAKRKDREHGEANSKHEAKESKPFEAGEQEGAKEGADQNDVVAQHGKALKVTIHHDHEGHKHHVTSHHADGHVNESDHETPEDAHAEAGKLAEVSPDIESEDEGQRGEDEMVTMGKHHDQDGFAMPPLD